MLIFTTISGGILKMRVIKCLFCGKPTTFHRINAQKKLNGKVITLSEAPVFYYKDCDETFISKEAQDVFSYIKDKNLDSKKVLFNFDEMAKKVESGGK